VQHHRSLGDPRQTRWRIAPEAPDAIHRDYLSRTQEMYAGPRLTSIRLAQ
jgi:hypothetical protein